jgi:hypothetical protein
MQDYQKRMQDYQERLNDLMARAKTLKADIMETISPAQAGADGLARAYFRADDLVRELESVQKGVPPCA